MDIAILFEAGYNPSVPEDWWISLQTTRRHSITWSSLGTGLHLNYLLGLSFLYYYIITLTFSQGCVPTFLIAEGSSAHTVGNTVNGRLSPVRQK
jgi:hypothetical protein